MTPYVQRLVGKTCILICCLLLTFQYISAQAIADAFLVSNDDDNKICKGESITFIATPPPNADEDITYTYTFYRAIGVGGRDEIEANNENIIEDNRYTYNTANATQNIYRVFVEIVAKPDGDPAEAPVKSNTIDVTILPMPTIIIKQNNAGIADFPIEIRSSDPEIVLAAVDENSPIVPLTGGFFTGEGVKRTGTNEYRFFPSFANPGRITISYTYTEDEGPGEGCTQIVQASINVIPNDDPIEGLELNYCIKDDPKPLKLRYKDDIPPYTCTSDFCFVYARTTTTYSDINISGNGITASGGIFTFNPLKAFLAGDKDKTTIQIKYKVTTTYSYYSIFNPGNITTESPNVVDITEDLEVALYPVDELKITNSGQELASNFCRSENLTLTGIPSSVNSQFKIKKPGSATYIDFITPFTIPWNVEGEKENYPAGVYEVNYIYANPNGCTFNKTIMFTLLEVPTEPYFSRKEYNYCVGETIPPLVSIADSGFTTLWRKDDPNAQATTGDTYDPKVNNTFANSVNIYVTQFNGTCQSPVVILTIRVSPQPEANFAYKNVCHGDTTEFKDATISNGNTILNKKWNFGDGDILPEGSGAIPPDIHGGRTTGTYDNPKHTYQTTGIYQVTLSLITSACPDSIIKPVYIFPVQSSFPYIETFETDAGGWLAKSDTLTSWKLKLPTGSTIIPDPSSPNAWITSNDADTYNSPENSFVESPCFILKNTLKPYVSVNIRSDIEEGLDGAVLQYVIDDGSKFDNELQWKVLGNSNQGINWYNASGIVSNPGGQSIALPIGWSGAIQDNTDNTRWITAKFNLAQVRQEAGTNPVRFRIAFSSNTDNPPNRSFDGFAFDNFIIGEINRTVLLEHFTNSSQSENIEETQKIYQAVQNNDIAAIQYHTSFPAPDSINNVNKSDPSARALLYGIAKTNSTVLDGLPPDNGNEHKPFSEAGWGSDRYSQRILFEAPFNIDIQLTTESENGPLQIAATLSKNNTLVVFDHPIIVQTAIVEKSVVSQAATFQNVLRNLLPDAAGKRLSGQWKASDETRTEVISNSWQPKNADAVANTFAVIVFLQDENTKEIYQAKEQLITIPVKADPSGGRNGIIRGEPDDFNEKSIGISPNPASSHVNISFGKATESELILLVYDALGKSIYTKIISKGAKEHMLFTESYPPGIYIVHLATPGNLKIFRKKVVIVR